MTERQRPRQVDHFLDDLRRQVLAVAPGSHGEEIVADIQEHLDETLPADASAGEVELALARLGSVSEIVNSIAPDQLERPQAAPWRTGLIVALILAGGVVVPVLGWIVGVFLLWRSDAWTGKEKWVGTLVPPGGLLPAAIIALIALAPSSSHCEGSATPSTGGSLNCTTTSASESALWIAAFLLALAIPCITARYLVRRSAA